MVYIILGINIYSMTGEMYMKKYDLIKKINEILQTIDERKLNIVYVFILGLKDKG